VVSVKSGKDGIKECKSDSFDLILMDIKSKNGIDGVQTLKEIRKIDKYRHIPILAVTGCAMPGDKEHILQEGFNGYLAKPFIKKTFMDFVKKYLPKS
jgi:CheY-like chemotaxis protein